MEKHDLLHEFPEHQEKIHQLKMENNHFRKLFNEYDEMEHQILRINSGIETMTDEAFKELKVKMLHLKDEIYTFLNN